MVNKKTKQEWRNRNKELTNKKLLNSKQKESLDKMINSPDTENLVLAKELLRLKISEALVANLNNGQINAFTKIINYFKDPEDYFGIVLKGYAGTGKTYLVKRIIDYIRAAYPHRKIAITAPTNKAVHVLNDMASKLKKDKIFEDYGRPSEKIVYCTIHKLLSLKEHISNTGKQTFIVNNKKADISEYHYLIIDEISMLNDDLFIKLLEFKNKIKFIFLGDPCQIPPIGKIDCIPFMKDPYYVLNSQKIPVKLLQLELTEIMRQKNNNSIINTSIDIRNNLQNLYPVKNFKTSLNEIGNGVVYINGKTQRKQIYYLIKKYFATTEFKTDPNFIKIIAWKNKTVNYLNNIVRQTLFGNNIDSFVIGDKLIANKALFERNKAINKWTNMDYIYSIKGNTSDEYTVIKTEIIKKTFSEKIKYSPKINFTGNFWKLTVKDKHKHNFILYVIHQDSINEFNEILLEFKTIALNSKSTNNWILYYNMLKWSDDVIYNYAITAHKSQGSTYQNVILIEEDLDKNHKIVERNRIKYTAYTRAINRLYILK